MAGSEEKARPTLPLRLSNSVTHSGSGMSPITDLAFNLSGLSTNSMVATPKRRISWSNCTPNRCILSLQESDQSYIDSPAQPDSPMAYDKLLKDIKHSQKTVRRVNTFPLHPLPCQDKENIPSNLTTDVVARKTRCLQVSTSDVSITSDSQDSGYSGSQTETPEEQPLTTFLQPHGHAPRRLRQESGLELFSTPSSSKQTMHIRNSLFADGEENEFLEIFEMENVNDDLSLPANLTTLLTKPIIHAVQKEDTIVSDKSSHYQTNKIVPRSGIRRCLSLLSEGDLQMGASNFNCLCHKWKSQHNRSCDNLSDVYRQVGDSGNTNNRCHAIIPENTITKEAKLAFKRPDPPRDFFCPIETKRRKSAPLISTVGSDSMLLSLKKKNLLQRCHSETEATIKRALQRSSQEPDLIGDFSKPFALPLVKGKHQDVKTISAETVMHLITDKYGDIVENFTVVDCRYPYEFDGGHIKDAKNIYTKEGIIEHFFLTENKRSENGKRNVVVFHCEFSSERGPTLYRYLRNMDRENNKDRYPLLNHPEIYVLDGGYKAFYESYKEWCQPQQYKPMLHKDHEKDLRHFRAKSKSWNGECKTRVAVRPGLKF